MKLVLFLYFFYNDSLFIGLFIGFIICLLVYLFNNMNDGESCWFTICDEKNIVLEKNNNNVYKITFSIHSENREDTVLNVLKNGQLFELLFALNPDVIADINVTERGHLHDVFITFKNGNRDDGNNGNNGEELDTIVHVHFSLKYAFEENKCILTSQKCEEDGDDERDETNDGSASKKGKKEYLNVSKIKLKAVEKGDNTSMSLVFKVDGGKKSSNITNMYIGLYFKKIFHRFKKYFE